MRRNEDLEATIVAKFVVMAPLLDERARRLWAAAESRAIGYGGDALVSAATGLARETIRNGRRELAAGRGSDRTRIRRAGAGRPGHRADAAGRDATRLEQLVEPLTRGDPDVAVAVDVQEPGEADGGVDDAGLAREFDDGGAAAARARLQPAGGAQEPRGRRRIRIATRSSSTSTRPPRRSCGASNR